MKNRIKNMYIKFKTIIKYILQNIKVIIYKSKNRLPDVKSFDETIDKIIYDRKSLCRFGDGEFDIINNVNIGFQQNNQKLSERLKDILENKNSNCLVGIPNIFIPMKDRTFNSRVFWTNYFVNNIIGNIDNRLNFNSTYYDAFISRPYVAYKDRNQAKYKFNRLKEIWNNKELIIIEGENSRLGIGNDLFSNAKSIGRILCPSKDAFEYYDEILYYAKKNDKSSIILIALGPTATVLAYDLSNYGYQAIDIGHIDIEYEWFLSNTKVKINIPHKFVNEVDGGDIIQTFKNEEYENQINERIII